MLPSDVYRPEFLPRKSLRRCNCSHARTYDISLEISLLNSVGRSTAPGTPIASRGDLAKVDWLAKWLLAAAALATGRPQRVGYYVSSQLNSPF